MPGRLIRFSIGLLATTVSATVAFAQQVPPALTNPATGENLSQGIRSRFPAFHPAGIPYEFWIFLLIGVWGLILLACYLYAARNARGHQRLEDVSRTILVIGVIVSAMLLATGGYADNQIAAAYGLFGSIVGYIFGRTNAHGNKTDEQPPISN